MLDLLAFLEALISCVVAEAALCAAVYNTHTNHVIKTADEFQTSNSRKTQHTQIILSKQLMNSNSKQVIQQRQGILQITTETKVTNRNNCLFKIKRGRGENFEK